MTPPGASTSDLADAYGARARIVPPVLRHFGGRRQFAGTVETIKCFEDNSRVKELLNTPGDGLVLVVDGGGSTRYALLGDNIGQEAVDHGWAGLVVYGCVRDTAILETLDLGVLALAATPRRSLKNGEGLASIAVEIAGIPVAPGDYLAADEDGIVLLDRAPEA